MNLSIYQITLTMIALMSKYQVSTVKEREVFFVLNMNEIEILHVSRCTFYRLSLNVLHVISDIYCVIKDTEIDAHVHTSREF